MVFFKTPTTKSEIFLNTLSMKVRRLMTIRKIDDGDGWRNNAICHDREHGVPTMISLPPGTYEHECPSCHKRTVFRVNGTQMSGGGWSIKLSDAVNKTLAAARS